MSLLRDPETDHLIGIEQAPHRQDLPTAEYPKWVPAHESHVVRRKLVDGGSDIISVPSFADFHVNRHDGAVMVLADDEDQEKRATSELQKAEPDARSAFVDERTPLQVARDIERAKAAQEVDVKAPGDQEIIDE